MQRSEKPISLFFIGKHIVVFFVKPLDVGRGRGVQNWIAYHGSGSSLQHRMGPVCLNEDMYVLYKVPT